MLFCIRGSVFCVFQFLLLFLSQRNCRNFNEKMIIFHFQSNFLRFYIRNISYQKLLFRKLFVRFLWLSRLRLCVSRHCPYLKNWRNFSEKMENFRVLVKLSKLLCQEWQISKGTIQLAFYHVFKTQFLQFKVFRYPYLKKIIEISVKKRNLEFFGFQSKFLCFGLRIRAILVYYYGSSSPWFQGFSFFISFISRHLT